MQALDTATENYIQAFTSFHSTLLTWGLGLFSVLLVISMVLLCLWNAFEDESMKKSMVKFLKSYFIILVFYICMVHFDWLMSIVDSAQFMGAKLANISSGELTPSKIFSQGLNLATDVINAVPTLNLLKISVDVLIMFICYIAVIAVFIYVALELALTQIIATVFVVMSGFLLAFAAVDATRDIARNTLNKILYYSIKLLTLYPVIIAGERSINFTENLIPKGNGGYSNYWWLVATVLLFYLLVKNLPDQVASVASHMMSLQGTNAAALGASVASQAKQVAVGGATGGMVATRGVLSTGSAMQSGASAFGAKIGSGIQNLASGFKSGFSNNANSPSLSATAPPKSPTGSSSTPDRATPGTASANVASNQAANTQGQASTHERKSSAQNKSSKPAKPPKASSDSAIVQRR